MPHLTWSCLQPAGAMTQQPQEGFEGSVEDAREWMKAVQERLQINDNTQGPRAALEARLRETEVGRGLASPCGWAGVPPAQPQVYEDCHGAGGLACVPQTPVFSLPGTGV